MEGLRQQKNQLSLTSSWENANVIRALHTTYILLHAYSSDHIKITQLQSSPGVFHPRLHKCISLSSTL